MGDGFEIQIRTAARAHQLKTRWIFNCTGPARYLHDIADPLIQQLSRDGLIRPNRWGYILESSESGEIRPGLWSVGALNKTPFGGAVAVQQISRQVKQLVEIV